MICYQTALGCYGGEHFDKLHICQSAPSQLDEVDSAQL